LLAPILFLFSSAIWGYSAMSPRFSAFGSVSGQGKGILTRVAGRRTDRRQRRRRLLVEQLEDRRLLTAIELGTIQGTKFADWSNNGVRDTDIIEGDRPDVIFVVDVSGSTGLTFGGGSVGDVNGDGRTNTILDGELAGFIALNGRLNDLGFGTTAEVGIVVFGRDAAALDMDPATPGVQLITTPTADRNGNNVPDVEEVLRSIQIGHAGVSSGWTNFEAALDKTIVTFTTAPFTGTPERNVVFISDGSPNFPGSSYSYYTDEVALLKAQPPQGYGASIRAFGAGTSSSLPALQAIDPNAQKFTTTDELLGVFSGTGDQVIFTEPGLNGWTIELVDADGNVIRTDVTHDIDLDGSGDIDPFSERGLYSFTDVPFGTYTVREVPQAGWRQTAPTPVPPGTHTVTIDTPEQVVSRIDFGNFEMPILYGRKFEDVNGNGVHEADEPGLDGWTIEVLDENNQVIASGVTPAGTRSRTAWTGSRRRRQSG
jgi:hypothetical protein